MLDLNRLRDHQLFILRQAIGKVGVLLAVGWDGDDFVEFVLRIQEDILQKIPQQRSASED